MAHVYLLQHTFTLRDPGLMNSTNVVLRPLRYFRQVIQSAIFGGQTVVQEFVSDLYPIQLPSSLGLLTFDATWAQAKSAHGEAKQKPAAMAYYANARQPLEVAICPPETLFSRTIRPNWWSGLCRQAATRTPPKCCARGS